jgi:transcriptional regulator with XRE-family HTH domain
MLRNLKVLRVTRGLSQGDVARLSGLSQSHISNLERGVRPRTTNEVEAVAKALGVSTTALTANSITLTEGYVAATR